MTNRANEFKFYIVIKPCQSINSAFKTLTNEQIISFYEIYSFIDSIFKTKFNTVFILNNITCEILVQGLKVKLTTIVF